MVWEGVERRRCDKNTPDTATFLERISKIGCAVKLLILDQLRLVKIVSPISIFYRFQKGACHGLERRAVATG
jgi:hypothetical protein